MISDADLRAIADRLVTVPGLVGVMLGGSRARGEHTADSDIDLGLYYRPPLGIDALSAVATSIAGPAAAVTVPGAWGPWVDGGAWLTIDGQAVDWIYRDLDRVHHSWSGAQDGHYQYHFQVGHPLGFPDFAYAGEVALGVVLADPSGELTALHEATTDYPHALTAALVRGIDEARFLLAVAAKATSRADSAYVAGCLFRIVGVCAHALHARAGRWLINEKGAVDAAGRLSVAPIDFTDRAQRLLAAPGHTPHALSVTLEAADDLVRRGGGLRRRVTHASQREWRRGRTPVARRRSRNPAAALRSYTGCVPQRRHERSGVPAARSRDSIAFAIAGG